jgi:hypothetical protein
MAMFNSYVSLPEGIQYIPLEIAVFRMDETFAIQSLEPD